MNSSRFSSPKSLQKRLKSQREWTEDDVKSHLESVFTSGGQDPAKAVRRVLEECKSEEKEACRKAVFEKCIDALNSDNLHTQVAKEVTGKLLFEVETLNGSSQVEIAEMIIRGLKEGHHASLDLFPKLLACIASHKSILYQKPEGGSGELMGEDHKSHLINSLFGCRWDPSCALHVTDMCREIPMSEDELKFLIMKILQMMKNVALSEIPPLVHQLLSLSRKGHRTVVLEGIKALFDKLDQTLTEQEEEPEGGVTSNHKKDLLTTEGTVFVHITFAVKQDPDLRKEFLKLLKAIQGGLSSSDLTLFSVSLVLSSLCIYRLEDQVYGFFKDVVLKAYKDEERNNSSRWLQEVTKDALDIESLLMTAVSCSASGWEQVVHGSGWDQVVQGLVSVGFYLMENFGPKSSALSQCGSPQRKACALGSKILFETFKQHTVVHRELVTRIVNHVMANAATHVTHYVDLLSRLMRGTSPMDLMDSLPKLKETLSYIALIPSHAAVPLLTAILPLVQFSPSLRDSLLLVLRKGLFSRYLDSRKTAVEGYLLLLRKFTVLDSLGSIPDSESSVSSQVTVEIHGRSHHGNEALCLEILGTLRRALTKQYDVRLSLYQGLYSVFCINTKLAEPILDLLLGHFTKFYEHETDITPPIKVTPCIKLSETDVSGTEPLDHLVCCVQLCVCRYLDREDGDEEVPAVIDEARQILASLVERMVSSELDDFELNKSSDFSSSSVGQKNRFIAQLAVGTYEALLDYTFCMGQFSRESVDQVLKLYHGQRELTDILQDKGSSGGGASSSHGNKRVVTAVYSKLSLQCVIRILKAIFNDQTPNHQQGLSALRESQSFTKYVLAVALQKIRQVHDSGECEGSYANHKPDVVFKHCCSLARLMFKHLEVGGTRASKREKGKSVAMYCLEGFSLLLSTAMVRWERGDEFLAAVNPSLDGSTSTNERTHYFIKHLQRVVCSVLDGSCKEWSLREAHLMVSDIELLTGTLELGSQELERVFEWASTQCRDHNVDDLPLTKALISLLLIARERHKSSVKTIKKLAHDVHYHLGDIDEDIELEAVPNFSIVNPRTAASCVIGLLFTHIDQVLVGVDWLVERLKAEATTPTEDNFGRPDTQVSTQSRDLCTAICERLAHLVGASSDLVQSSVSAVPIAEGLLKMMFKLFSTLGSLAKYVLDVFQHTLTIPSQFQKLVGLVGTELSQQVYLFLTFFQKLRISGGLLESEKGKKGGKGRSKVTTSGKSKNTVRKESRSFSSLIYSIEQFEKHLILLDKKAKMNLMEPFKHSMSRDFRIDAQRVGNILDDDETSTEGEEDEECNPPEAKRLKST